MCFQRSFTNFGVTFHWTVALMPLGTSILRWRRFWHWRTQPTRLPSQHAGRSTSQQWQSQLQMNPACTLAEFVWALFNPQHDWNQQDTTVMMWKSSWTFPVWSNLSCLEESRFTKADEQLENLSKDARILVHQRPILKGLTTHVWSHFKASCPSYSHSLALNVSGKLAYERDSLQFARDVATLGQLLEADSRSQKLALKFISVAMMLVLAIILSQVSILRLCNWTSSQVLSRDQVLAGLKFRQIFKTPNIWCVIKIYWRAYSLIPYNTI